MKHKKVFTLTTSLQMNHEDQARLDFKPVPDLEIVRATQEDANTIKEFYQGIGENHLWVDRRGWEIDDFEMQIAQERTIIWLARLKGRPIGFLEAYHYPDNRIQIIFLGILDQYSGRGIGKHLLSHGISSAWQRRPSKMIVHTRSYDGEHALNNYVKRGFQITKVRPQIIAVPPAMQETITKLIITAKRRGVYPSFAKRLEARLRQCFLGRSARWIFHNVMKSNSP
ncbi:MAG: GNAT family N-acetyltransferase [Syntrophaceae bacterium]|nr:GNAT family N-acetyltransferase [Syntrophaceae bacterium]